MINHTKTFYENVVDALNYAVSDRVSIIVIGVILTLISTMQYFEVAFTGWGILINVCLIILTLFEAGYSSKIVEETINGSTEPPVIENVFEIFREGIDEFLIYFGYLLIASIVTSVIYIGGAFYPELLVFALFFSVFISSALFFIIQMAMVYKAHKKGGLKEGFNFKGLSRFCRKLGLWGCIFFFIASFISQAILVSSVFNVSSLEIVVIIKFILKFTLAPISLIFSLRLMALQGKLY